MRPRVIHVSSCNECPLVSFVQKEDSDFMNYPHCRLLGLKLIPEDVYKLGKIWEKCPLEEYHGIKQNKCTCSRCTGIPDYYDDYDDEEVDE